MSSVFILLVELNFTEIIQDFIGEEKTKEVTMSPKEKAEDLYSKYYNRIEHALSEDVSGFER